MSLEKDLNKYNIRTDLAIEQIDNGIKHKKNGVTITDITLDEISSKKINKKPGNYITVEFSDVTDYENRKKVEQVLSSEIKKLIKKMKIKEDSSCLVIGLGNEKTTPDAVGPLSISNIIVTNQLYVYDKLDEGFRRVWAISPGVMGETGIETSDFISGVVSKIKPDFIIVIDALASSSIERVNKTIQMTDAGINPGSGVGNKRKEISKDTLNIPVLAIGVPTVVDATSIVSDTINYMYKHFAYLKENYDNPALKLKVKFNYLNNNYKIEKNDKKELLGLVGQLDEKEVRKLIYEILNPIGYNLMVTPKEEDFIVESLSSLISNSINKALHKEVK